LIPLPGPSDSDGERFHRAVFGSGDDSQPIISRRKNLARISQWGKRVRPARAVTTASDLRFAVQWLAIPARRTSKPEKCPEHDPMSDLLFRQRPVYSANNFLWSSAPQPQAGVIDPDSSTERGLPVKKRFSVILTTVAVLAAVADLVLFVWAVFSLI
jgi:hypothetical protein